MLDPGHDCTYSKTSDLRCRGQLQGHLGVTLLVCVQVIGAEELFSEYLETEFRP